MNTVLLADTLTIGSNKPNSMIPLGGKPAKITAVVDQTSSTKSNVEFEITNTGIFGSKQDFSGEGVGGGIKWPRNGKGYYLYGSGLWLGAVKNVNGTPSKLCVASYNPNSSRSSFQPSLLTTSPDLDSLQQTRVFRSTDFNSDGTSIKKGFAANWMIWDTDPARILYVDGYTGNFVANPLERNQVVYPGGTVVISDEDFITVFDDQDLNKYYGKLDTLKKQGYPINIRVIQCVYSWSSDFLKDAVIIEQKIINIGDDTLFNCSSAPVFDFDITPLNNTTNFAYDDNFRYLKEDTALKLSVMWTEANSGEKGNGFGYMGIGFVRTPTVNNQGYLLTDIFSRDRSKQIGAKTIRSWTIDGDPIDNIERYDFITRDFIDTSVLKPSDKRFIMSTSGFNLRPHDTATIAYIICFAKPSVKPEADGSWNDVQGVVNLFKKTRAFYDATFDKKTLGVETVEKDNNALRVYPNPSSSYLLLQSEFSSETLHLYNVLGETVRTVKTDDKGSCIINIQDLPNGVYFCRNSIKNSSKAVQVMIAR